MARVRSIGKPENASERKAISHLKNNLPDDYIILTNLELVTKRGFPYEYDLIIIGAHAVYVGEIKGYGGRIRGNAYEWQLGSGAIHKSPIPLTNKKAKIVSGRLERYSPTLRNVWVQSLIIITDEKASIQIKDPQATKVVKLKDSVEYLTDPEKLHVGTSSISKYKERIEEAIIHQFTPLKRDKEIGDYTVMEVINKNDLFSTILAEHKMVPKRYILKVYNLNLYEDSKKQKKTKEWLLRDANALFRMPEHRNLVKANPPFPWQDNKIVLPIEWVDGYTLRGQLEEKSFNIGPALDIISQLSDALEHIHNNDIVHRDIRPENIILQNVGPIKLVNFDCARIEDENLITIASRIGRYLDERYVAPEIWLNPSSASKKSDIFSMGIVFFELLTGTTPFEKIKELFVAGGLEKLPTDIDPDLDPDVDELIEGMCAFDPDARFGDIMEIKELLEIIK